MERTDGGISHIVIGDVDLILWSNPINASGSIVLIRVFEKDISANNLTSRTGGTAYNTPGGDNAVSKKDTIAGSIAFRMCGDEDKNDAKFTSVVGD